MDELKHIAECVGFQWDKGNLLKIWERHGVAPLECEEVFFNEPLMAMADEKHSTQEDRYYALGSTDSGRLLFISFTIRAKLIRVISARNMSRRERRIITNYEKENT
jgi:uncharacterized DUF497 family protein